MTALSQWQTAMLAFKAGTGKATVVAIGDSITEGYNAGANATTTDMWPTRTSNTLAAVGSKSNGSYYLPTGRVSCGLLNGFGPFAEGSDPWTRSGTIGGVANDNGLGLRSCQLATSAGYFEKTAPSWATHAVVQYKGNGGARVPITITSNSILVHSETITDSAEHQAIVPLQGSGNALRVTLTDSTAGFLQLHGVIWQKDAHPAGMILATTTISGNANLGGTTSPSLAGFATGELMVAVAVASNGATSGMPATPAGWTSRATYDGATAHYRVCTRVKVAADTATWASGGGLNTIDVVISGFSGATWGSISSPVSNNAAGTSIDPPAMALTMGDASVIAVGSNSASGLSNPYTFPTGWFPHGYSAQNTSVGIARKTFGIETDSPPNVDPGAVSFTSASDRVTWQIDLVRTNNDRSALAFVEVIDCGHGGYGATTYANPVSSGTIDPYSTDTDFTMYQNIAALSPNLIVIFLGLYDARVNTSAQFQTDLEAMVTQIDAHMTTPDILLVTYPYLDGTLAGLPYYSPATWATFETAATAVAANHSTRARHLKLSDYFGPLDGTTTSGFTSSDHAHPTASGHHDIGDRIATTLLEGVSDVTVTVTAADATAEALPPAMLGTVPPPAEDATSDGPTPTGLVTLTGTPADATADFPAPVLSSAPVIVVPALDATAMMPIPALVRGVQSATGRKWEFNPFTGTLDIVTTLNESGVTAGTYGGPDTDLEVEVDEFGRVVAITATDVAASGVPLTVASGDTYTIPDNTQVPYAEEIDVVGEIEFEGTGTLVFTT